MDSNVASKSELTTSTVAWSVQQCKCASNYVSFDGMMNGWPYVDVVVMVIIFVVMQHYSLLYAMMMS